MLSQRTTGHCPWIQPRSQIGLCCWHGSLCCLLVADSVSRKTFAAFRQRTTLSRKRSRPTAGTAATAKLELAESHKLDRLNSPHRHRVRIHGLDKSHWFSKLNINRHHLRRDKRHNNLREDSIPPPPLALATYRSPTSVSDHRSYPTAVTAATARLELPQFNKSDNLASLRRQRVHAFCRDKSTRFNRLDNPASLCRHLVRTCCRDETHSFSKFNINRNQLRHSNPYDNQRNKRHHRHRN